MYHYLDIKFNNQISLYRRGLFTAENDRDGDMDTDTDTDTDNDENEIIAVDADLEEVMKE